MKITKGDLVQVITGNNKGKTGRVIKVFLSKDKILVEGINIIKKHSRPTQDNPQGGIIEKEAAIHISNLAHIDPKDDKPTRIGYKSLEGGRKVRFAKRSGEVIDK